MGGLNDSVEILCPNRRGKEGSLREPAKACHNLKYLSALKVAFFREKRWQRRILSAGHGAEELNLGISGDNVVQARSDPVDTRKNDQNRWNADVQRQFSNGHSARFFHHYCLRQILGNAPDGVS